MQGVQSLAHNDAQRMPSISYADCHCTNRRPTNRRPDKTSMWYFRVPYERGIMRLYSLHEVQKYLTPPPSALHHQTYTSLPCTGL
jgi:hypothetical protein